MASAPKIASTSVAHATRRTSCSRTASTAPTATTGKTSSLVCSHTLSLTGLNSPARAFRPNQPYTKCSSVPAMTIAAPAAVASLRSTPHCRTGKPVRPNPSNQASIRISPRPPRPSCPGWSMGQWVTRHAVPEAEFGGERLQVGLAGQPGERAVVGVMGQQRDRDAEWRLPAPVGLDVGEEVLPPCRVEALVGVAEGVLQSVGVPPAGWLRGHRGGGLRPWPAASGRDDLARPQTAAGIVSQ
jgi:hypothetical protein